MTLTAGLVTSGVVAEQARAAPQGWSKVAADDFGRTSSVGLGSAKTGGAYTLQGPKSAAKISKNEGLVTLRKGEQLTAKLNKVRVTDTNAVLTTTIVTKKTYDTQSAVLVRQQGDGSGYSVRVRIAPSGAATLGIRRTNGATSTWLRGANLPSTVKSGQAFRTEVDITGTSPAIIRVRAWAGSKTPAWQIKYADSANAITTPGGVGIKDSVATASGSIVFRHDNLGVTGALVTTLDQPATSAPPPPVSSPPPSSPSGAPFVHPGIVDSRAQLDFVRAKIKAGQQPWTSALYSAQHSYLSHLDREPKPVAYVKCGAHNNPNIGCEDEVADAQAAYTDALIWYYTGNQAYADESIKILNAWSAVLKDHPFDSTVYQNGLLQAGWSAETFTKAAELIRYSGAGWKPADITRFESMLRTAFLPRVRNGWTNCCANWQVSMAEATMNIGVFINDRSVFDDGLSDWRNHTRAAIYLTSDGPTPNLPANTIVKPSTLKQYWFNPNSYVQGEVAETCRDLGHTAMTLAAIVNAAETAQIQGIDLYGQEQNRIVNAFEFNTRFLNNPYASGWTCPNPVNKGGNAADLTFDMGYSHYSDKGIAMPETKKWLQKTRNTKSGLQMNWETLTHARAPF